MLDTGATASLITESICRQFPPGLEPPFSEGTPLPFLGTPLFLKQI